MNRDKETGNPGQKSSNPKKKRKRKPKSQATAGEGEETKTRSQDWKRCKRSWNKREHKSEMRRRHCA